MLRFFRGVRSQGFLALIGELWREYGDVFAVKIGTRTLMFALHPDAVEYVNVKQRKRYGKARSYDVVRKYLTGDGLVASTGTIWRRQRKLMAPMFTPKAVETYAELMIADSERMLDRWDGLAREGQPVEIAEEMTQLTASIILRAMFSSETIESIDRMKNAVEVMVAYVNGRLTGTALPIWVPTGTNRRYVAARTMVRRSITGLIEERRGTDSSSWPDDLLSRLMTARDEETGEPMSEALLRDESITAFFAGHETTARTLTFTWYALARHPEVAAKLHEELDRVLGGRPPTVEDVSALVYTRRVIQEVLRLHPAVPMYIRDALEDDSIGGFDVTAGTGVMLCSYYTHRHPDAWDEPETFDPDRWGNPPTKNGAYHPFAIGPRICIGNHFSLLESVLVLAVLAQRFAPALPADYEPKWEMKGVLSVEGGMPMTIAAR